MATFTVSNGCPTRVPAAPEMINNCCDNLLFQIQNKLFSAGWNKEIENWWTQKEIDISWERGISRP